ncbi:MAG: hypothetical protein OXE98_07565 [Hyphomicrobiales bacterium]|nr:hypothetical protein [Hyphomicrobiales bacterium]
MEPLVKQGKTTCPQSIFDGFNDQPRGGFSKVQRAGISQRRSRGGGGYEGVAADAELSENIKAIDTAMAAERNGFI